MLSKLFKRKPKEEDESKQAILVGMVAIDNVQELDSEKCFKLYNQDNSNATIEEMENRDSNIFFQVNGDTGFISVMPAPIPWSDLEGPCLTAWHWPQATEEMRKHNAHVLVSIMPKNKNLSVLDRTLTITKLIASVAEATDALGVYWGAGTLVQSKNHYISIAQDANRDNLPITLWVEFRLEKNEDSSVNLITTGMEAFGHKEFEIVKSDKEITALLGLVDSFATYVLDNGPIINDGDTIGVDENQKIHVTYSPSVWNRSNSVIRIEY